MNLNFYLAHFFTIPNDSFVYYYHKYISVFCEPYSILRNVWLVSNTIERHYFNLKWIGIGGTFNKNNDTICVFCTSYLFVTPTSCFIMIGKNAYKYLK